jgi:uncharacterized protein (DUF697 family)
MNEREAIAAIRIIGAVARADGKITDEERGAFREAVADLNPTLPGGTSAEQLLLEDCDVDAELAQVNSNIMRRAIFDYATAIAVSDGTTSEENKILARIRTAFALERDAGPSLFDQVNQRMPAKGANEPLVSPVLDPKERTVRVRNIISQKAFWAGVFGAIPLPLVSDIGVLFQIDAVISSVALTWGHALTRRERIAQFGVWVSIATAQIAVHSLIKLIPGWGSTAGAVGGALTAYLVTFAIGGVVNHHFEREGKATAAELKKVFAEQKLAARAAYDADKSKIDAMRDTNKEEIAALHARLEKKEITPEQFDAELDALNK